MERTELHRMGNVVGEVALLRRLGQELESRRARLHEDIGRGVRGLERRAIPIGRGGSPLAKVVVLTTADEALVGALWLRRHLPVGDPIAEGLSEEDIQRAEEALTVASRKTSRFFLTRSRRERLENSLAFLAGLRDWHGRVAITRRLEGLRAALALRPPSVLSLDGILDPAYGLARVMRGWSGAEPVAIDRRGWLELGAALAIVGGADALEDQARSRALQAGAVARKAEVALALARMPVERLRDATNGRVRVAPLAEAGIQSVQQVLENADSLEFLPGIGEASALRLASAAWSISQTLYEETPIRVDVKRRATKDTDLLRALAVWDAVRGAKPGRQELDAFKVLEPLDRKLESAALGLVLPASSASMLEFRRLVGELRSAADALQSANGRLKTDPWGDFLARPADYFTMLAELGLTVEDERTVHGDLPEEIVEAVRAQELRTEHLRASLRGYQAFAARFAIVQRKVIIGDEMGLGKTVEALAVLAHLRSAGEHHSLVVCPAAVVTNWVREVAAKSSLRPFRLHGSGRDQEARNWQRSGGVAVTTFDSLGWFDRSRAVDLACLVVDEAHYIKNPQALRAQRTVALLQPSPRAILLTGTPLENRVEEFRNLASYVRPDLVVDASDFAPKRFRRQIAPAYLRRNQEDVLAELPELIEVDEWLPMTIGDRGLYVDAVRAGNFMAMRQAGMRAGRESEKVARLLEIIDEARANGRRVIVFSYFRDVLGLLSELVPGEVFGPVTGSVPAPARQIVVDSFGAADGAVLLAQIVAGGQGLNIQAASVVVICEPQIKPTLEAQAIARAHRMGQVQSVQVHRLLSEEGVDRRIVEILAEKRRLFDEFARESVMVSAAPEALDVTEAALARQVVAEERERLARDAR